MSLDTLSRRIARRDKLAFAELYQKTSRIVYAVCLGVVKNAALAEELTQETFVTVWEKSGTFKGNGYKTWILTIAKNKSFNALKRGKREVFVDFSENENLGGRYEISDRVETGVALKAALELLNETDRQIVLLKNTGVKTKEISALLSMPRGTVSWRYAEALKRLKNYLEDGK
ncbi:MAG: RNA polymerase sigma factor [Clostridia bacterium]|nr:RNA polymerase sigma factor [Clostridia bacterium]